MLALPSIVTAQFLGSWSDTYGRKIPMLLPPVGECTSKLFFQLIAILWHNKVNSKGNNVTEVSFMLYMN